MKPYPPLGLLYISSWLTNHQVKNEVYDSTFKSPQSQLSYLLNKRPGIIAIYTNLMTKVQVIKLIGLIKSTEKLSHALIVLGGPDTTYNIENYLDNGADVLVIGEGERTMLELIYTYRGGGVSALKSVDGIAFKDEQGHILKTKPREKIKNIDEIPIPARDKIDIHQYLTTWHENHGSSAINISTQRGCPYTCKWCSTAVYGQSYRRRSPENVIAELKVLNESYNPGHYWFVDDVFTVSHKWLRNFHAAMKDSNLTIKYECITRADRMNEEVIQLLKDTGCFRVWIGAESGSQKILDLMDRRVDATWVQKMIIESKKAGLEAGTFIMLGYPGETVRDIKETINHLKASNPDHFTITVTYPIKGTSLYQEVESITGELPQWDDSTDRDIDFTRTYPRNFYKYAVVIVFYY